MNAILIQRLCFLFVCFFAIIGSLQAYIKLPPPTGLDIFSRFLEKLLTLLRLHNVGVVFNAHLIQIQCHKRKN